MANIIRQWPAGDGYYVHVTLPMDQVGFLFSGTPTAEEIADKITAHEQWLTDEIVARTIIESEEVDHGLQFI